MAGLDPAIQVVSSKDRLGAAAAPFYTESRRLDGRVKPTAVRFDFSRQSARR
jgi:hypothetical protein